MPAASAEPAATDLTNLRRLLATGASGTDFVSWLMAATALEVGVRAQIARNEPET